MQIKSLTITALFNNNLTDIRNTADFQSDTKKPPPENREAAYSIGAPKLQPYDISGRGESPPFSRGACPGKCANLLLLLRRRLTGFILDPFQIRFTAAALNHFVQLLTHDVLLK